MATGQSVQIPVTTEVPGISLTLSMDEANMLTSILGRVGGSPNTSPREHVDSVYKALTTNGAKRGIDYDHPFSDLLDGGALYFGDYKE
jgi:hypothetical protein